MAPAGSQQLLAQDPAPARRCGTGGRTGHRRDGNKETVIMVMGTRTGAGTGAGTSTGMSYEGRDDNRDDDRDEGRGWRGEQEWEPLKWF